MSSIEAVGVLHPELFAQELQTCIDSKLNCVHPVSCISRQVKAMAVEFGLVANLILRKMIARNKTDHLALCQSVEFPLCIWILNKKNIVH